jgi:hypothetical protein
MIGGTAGKARPPHREGVTDIEAVGVVVIGDHGEGLNVRWVG